MRVKVEVDFRRPARRTLAVLLVVLVLSVPAVALANHQFADVPTGHTFHNEISAIAAAGIANGFNDGGFHPSDPVTRQAMAAFLHRGLGRVGMATGTATLAPALVVAPGVYTSGYIPIRQLTITVPGTDGPDSLNQMAFLQGRVVFHTNMNSAQGCTCEFGAFIVDTSSGNQTTWMYQLFDDDEPAARFYSFMVDGVLPVTPGSRTFQLMLFAQTRSYIGMEGTFTLHGSTSLVAMTFPFGPAGTTAL